MGKLKQASLLFAGISIICLFGFLLLFVDFQVVDTFTQVAYIISRSLCYSVLYLAIPMLINLFLYQYLKKIEKVTKRAEFSYSILFILLMTLPFVAVYADYQIYKLYGYHFNAFIWNILTTRGGIEALGATSSTKLSIFFDVLLIIITAIAIFSLCIKSANKTNFYFGRKKILWSLLSFFIILGIEEVSFAYAKQVGNTDILQAASYTPFPLPTSMTKIFRSMGIEKVKNSQFMPNEKVKYPLQEIVLVKKEECPNIIILTAESFRWDLLNPEITPNLWKFSKESFNFTNHYSGGNRTRMGMFSLFYGLYAPYWYPFEKEKISPVLMDTIQRLDYQIELNTSQSFDYPELRRTLFAKIPEKNMHELKNGPSWKRDVENIDMIIDMITTRDLKKPFFNFMFFESTHAPYNFPKEAIIRNDFEPDVDYMKISSSGDSIYRIHNRYINAAHHIDQQVGKLLTYLQSENLMENTIVLFTGDHGEEFMERGRWGHGHNSRFTMYQTRVPFILSVPGEKPRTVETETNHLQFPAFLMSKLGVTNDIGDYTLAPSLLAPKPDYFLIGNYNYITLQDNLYKITFPFTGQDYFHYNIYHKNDDAFVLKSKEISILKSSKNKLSRATEELHKFYESRDEYEPLTLKKK